jgi:hypothetical protein
LFRTHSGETGATQATLRDLAREKLNMSSGSFHYSVNDLLTRKLLVNTGKARPFLELAK